MAVSHATAFALSLLELSLLDEAVGIPQLLPNFIPRSVENHHDGCVSVILEACNELWGDEEILR